MKGTAVVSIGRGEKSLPYVTQDLSYRYEGEKRRAKTLAWDEKKKEVLKRLGT